MPVPNDGTQQLPSDSNGNLFTALWDKVNNVFRAPQGDANGNAYTATKDGANATLGSINDTTTANTVIGRLKALIALFPTALTTAGNLKTAIQEAIPAGTNVIGAVLKAHGTPNVLTPVTVAATTPATLLIAANANRKELVLINNSGQSIFIGNSSAVTTSNGAEWITGTSFEDRYSGSAWYGIVASGTATVTGWETA